MKVWNHPTADIEMSEEAVYMERQLPGYRKERIETL